MAKLFLIFMMTFFSALVLAGPRVGNGGGGWACYQDHSLQWIKLVDLYEAKNEYGLNLLNFEGASFESIYKKIYDRLNQAKHLYPHNLYLHLSNVKKQMRLVASAELTLIEDAHFRIFPGVSDCPGGKVTYLQLANFTFDGRLLIREDIWSALSPTDQVALVFHEAFYSLFRELYSDETSDRARRAVGLLFSDISAPVLESKLNEIHFLASSPHGNPLHEDVLPFIIQNVEVKNYITKTLDHYCVHDLAGLCGNQVYFKLFSILPQDGQFVGEPSLFKILLPYIIRYQLRGQEVYCDFSVEVLQERNIEGIKNQLKSLNYSCKKGNDSQ